MAQKLDLAMLKDVQNIEQDAKTTLQIQTQGGHFDPHGYHFLEKLIPQMTTEQAPAFAFRALQRFELYATTGRDMKADSELRFIHDIAKAKKPVASKELHGKIDSILTYTGKKENTYSSLSHYKLIWPVANNAAVGDTDFARKLTLHYTQNHDTAYIVHYAPDLARANPETAKSLYFLGQACLLKQDNHDFIYPIIALADLANKPADADEALDMSIALLNNNDAYQNHNVLVQLSYLGEHHGHLFTADRLNTLSYRALGAVERATEHPDKDDNVDLLQSYTQFWTNMLYAKRDYFNTADNVENVAQFALSAFHVTDENLHKNARWSECWDSASELTKPLSAIARQHNFTLRGIE